jgi:Domain of unknown function (DUF4832)/Domain of unknown function (DUF4874)
MFKFQNKLLSRKVSFGKSLLATIITATSLSACLNSTPPSPIASPNVVEFIETTYRPFAGKLLNPDRGFYATENLIDSTIGGVKGQPDYLFLRRDRGYTLIRVLVRLDDFRNGPISQAAIDQMNAGFANLRLNGLKAQLGFSYNFPTHWDVSNPPPDAPLNVVLGHLDQLEPVLKNNQDVIASMSRGFIGAWGEGHASSNGLDEPAAKKAIFEKIFSIFPTSRMVQLRTVQEMQDSLPTKLTADNAHDKSVTSRTGLINACFMVNDSDAGTYLPTDKIDAQKQYLADISKYALIGGETCEVPTTTRRDNCTNARIELARYHFTYLNDSFYGPTIENWKKDGCFDEIANKLGYRIELLRSSIAKTTKAGSAFVSKLVLKNTGYAAPYNPRGFNLALRNKETLQIIWLRVLEERDPKRDPRFWLPENGEISIDLAPVIPASAPAGKYQVLLALNDPNQELSSKPFYSIRTANEGIWEEGSGWNKLTDEIEITK